MDKINIDQLKTDRELVPHHNSHGIKQSSFFSRD